MKNILKLDYPRVWRTYTGGRLIDQLHDKDIQEDGHYPEEWIMSLTEAINPNASKKEGLSKIVDLDMTLKAYIEKYPEETLGKEFCENNGSKTAVLVKFIDSLERLTLQVHPTKKDAKKYFNSEFGKTECWYFLEGREIKGVKPHVYLGFKKGVTKELWKDLFLKQDINGMLESLNRIEVSTSDCVLIEGGLPHAIGSGCFLIEIQEPTDYTIRVEKKTPSGLEIDPKLIHQGIGYDNMFELFDYTNYTIDEVKEKYFVKKKKISQFETSLIDYDRIDYFKMSELNIKDSHKIIEDSFYGIVIISGSGKIHSGIESYEYKKGDQFFIPKNTQEVNLIPSSETKIIKCFGPKK